MIRARTHAVGMWRIQSLPVFDSRALVPAQPRCSAPPRSHLESSTTGSFGSTSSPGLLSYCHRGDVAEECNMESPPSHSDLAGEKNNVLSVTEEKFESGFGMPEVSIFPCGCVSFLHLFIFDRNNLATSVQFRTVSAFWLVLLYQQHM